MTRRLRNGVLFTGIGFRFLLGVKLFIRLSKCAVYNKAGLGVLPPKPGRQEHL
jgi:hypothetical protein